MANTPSDARIAYAVAPERTDGELLSIGQPCSAVEQKCTVVDFLPYACDHCKKRFCHDHRLPESHSCEKWDASMADRRALECPLCSELIAIPPGEDPNIKLGRHVDESCVVMTGKAAKKSTTPTCTRPRCGKPLWQPITCEKCQRQFCASHRYPKDHQCPSMSTPVSTPPPIAQTNPLANITSQTTARSAAAMAALKRSFASTNLDGSSSSASSTPPSAYAPVMGASTSTSSAGSTGSSNKPRLPFSSKDRRAISERKSQLRAMEERQRKGLLNEQEQRRLQELQESMKDDKECIIM